MNTQRDHQEGFSFNRLITDFKPWALSLMTLKGGAEHVQSMKVLGVLQPSIVVGDTLNKRFVFCVGHIHSSL